MPNICKKINYQFTPEKEAFNYPFTDLGHSFVVTNDFAIPLKKNGNCRSEYFTIDDGDHQGKFLDQFLFDCGYVELGDRYPIISYGSLRDPDHVARRFQKIGQFAVPVIKAKLHDIDVVYPAHISSYGVITSTIVNSAGVDANVYVLFVTKKQLEVLHHEENTGKNFDLVKLHDRRVILENNEIIRDPILFINKFGPLYLYSDHPFRLKRVSAENHKLEEYDLDQIITKLIDDALGNNLGIKNKQELQNYALESDENRIKIRAILDRFAKTGDLAPEQYRLEISALNSPDNPRPIPENCYRQINSFIGDNSSNQFFLQRTDSDHRTKGNYSAVISDDIAKKIGIGLMRRLFSRNRIWPFRFADISISNQFTARGNDAVFDFIVTASAMVDPDVKYKNTVRLDKTLRVALSAHEGECLHINAFKMTLIERIKETASRLFGYQYIYCRVQKAYFPDMEKNICRMPKFAFDVLGMDPGGIVVIQSVSKNDHIELRTKKIKTAIADEFILDERKDKSSPEPRAYYPDFSYLFGIKNDIYPLFMDAHAAQKLNIKRGMTVRVRRSIKDSLLSEIMPILILIVGALITWVIRSRDQVSGPIILAVLLALGFFIILKVRNKTP